MILYGIYSRNKVKQSTKGVWIAGVVQ